MQSILAASAEYAEGEGSAESAADAFFFDAGGFAS
jgi:hypothetical protein